MTSVDIGYVRIVGDTWMHTIRPEEIRQTRSSSRDNIDGSSDKHLHAHSPEIGLVLGRVASEQEVGKSGIRASGEAVLGISTDVRISRRQLQLLWKNARWHIINLSKSVVRVSSIPLRMDEHYIVENFQYPIELHIGQVTIFVVFPEKTNSGTWAI